MTEWHAKTYSWFSRTCWDIRRCGLQSLCTAKRLLNRHFVYIVAQTRIHLVCFLCYCHCTLSLKAASEFRKMWRWLDGTARTNESGVSAKVNLFEVCSLHASLVPPPMANTFRLNLLKMGRWIKRAVHFLRYPPRNSSSTLSSWQKMYDKSTLAF